MGAVWSSLTAAVVGHLFGVIQQGLAYQASAEAVPIKPYYSLEAHQTFPADCFPGPEAISSSAKGPDISYEYNKTKHLARKLSRLEAGGLESQVPSGWPESLEGPLVWTTSDFQEENSFIYTLSESDKVEIVDAVRHFKALGVHESLVDKASFPLPKLGETLSAIQSDLYNGRGFATLRGIDVDALSPDDLGIVYLGTTAYIAEQRGMQDRTGTMMINVVNDTERSSIEHQNVEMPFHTDLCCDTLAMLTVSCGLEGGAGVIASGWTVYNELAKTRPDLIHVLAQPEWPFDTHGRDPPYYKRALMYLENGRLIINFSRRLLVGHEASGPRTPGIPALNEAQAEALDALHEIGRRHEVKHLMKRGDIRFINNLALMHRRDTFVDTAENYRHLLRLWLHHPTSQWTLPMDLQLAWDRIFNHQEREEQWHFVRGASINERYVEPLWQTTRAAPALLPARSRGPEPPGPFPPVPPTTMCD